MPTLQDLQELEELDKLRSMGAKPGSEPSTWDNIKSAAASVGHGIGLLGTSALKGITSNVVGALDAVGSQPDFGDAIRARNGLPPRPMTQPGEIADKVAAMGVTPNSKLEQYVDSIIQGTGGALAGPGGVLAPGKAAVAGASAGLGSQAAGDVPGVKGTKFEPAARLAGGVLAGGLAGALASQRKNAPALAAEVLGDVNPIDLDKAKELMVKARMAGVPLNASQAMPNPSNLDNAVGMLTKLKEGQVLTDQLREQPRQTRTLANRLMSALPGEVRGDQVIANSTQDAATEALQAARVQRTAATAPLFQQSGDVPPKLLDDLIAKVSSEAATAPDTNKGGLLGTLATYLQRAKDRTAPQPTGLLDARGNPIMGPAQPLSMNELNATMRSQLNQARNVNMSSSANDREAIGSLQSMIGSVRDDLGAVSPKFKQANDLYSQISADRVDPLKKGVIGDVMGLQGTQADKSAVNKITSVLKAGRGANVPAEDSQILQFANETKANPNVFRDAVKTHIANAIDEADKQIANSDAPNFPKALEKSLLGDASQRQGFKDMLNGIELNAQVPMPKNSLYQGLLNGMKILNAAGKRPGTIGPGSANMHDVAGQSGVATALRATSFNAGPMAGHAVSRWLSSDAYRKIAEGLSTPEGLENLQKLAKLPIMSPAAQVIVNSMLGAGAANSVPGIQNSNEGTEPEDGK